MDIEIKQKYIKMILKVYEELKKTDILDRLQDAEAILTFEFYAESDEGAGEIPIEDAIPIGYIYNKEFFTNPSNLFNIVRNKKNKENKELYTSFLKGIVASINQFRLNGVFDEIQKFMAWDIIRYDIPYSNGEYLLFLKQIDIYIDKIKVLTVKEYDNPGIPYDEDIVFDQNRVYGEIDDLMIKTISPLNKNIKKQIWFENLCKESQQLIIAGENLISSFDKEIVDSHTSNYDLSCFLLPFVKAIEREVPHLVVRYIDKLAEISEQILNTTRNMKVPTHHKSIVNTASLIKKNRYNVEVINSISNLYKIIHYFGFVENLVYVENAESIFDKGLMDHLRKEKRIIEELEHLGRDRNNFVHSRIITQISEFRLHLEKLYLVLEFLAMFKQLSKQNN